MVKLPYAIDLRCPGWKKWLKQLGDQHRDEYYSAKVAAGAQDPLERTRAKILAAVKIRQMSKHA